MCTRPRSLAALILLALAPVSARAASPSPPPASARPPGPAAPVPVVRPDDWIELRARLALLTSSELGGAQFAVHVRGGVVQITGAALSTSQRARAEQLVKSIDGVRGVQNAMTAPATGAAGPTAPLAPESGGRDVELREQATRRLQDDPAWRTISVSGVQDGILHVVGTAELPVTVAALEALRAIPGVRALRSDIEAPRAPSAAPAAPAIAPSPAPPRRIVRRPDAWITMWSRVALLFARGVKSWPVYVDTENGVVTISGRVRTPWEKDRVERVVRGVTGVRQVVNGLEVRPPEGIDLREAQDEHLRREVRERLAADGSLSGITVADVRDGVVVLRGRAGLPETLRAIAIARKVAGVAKVDSRVDAPESGFSRDSSSGGPAVTGVGERT